MFQFRTHCVFEPPFGGLGTTYDVHLGLIGKLINVNSIELFLLGVTAHAATSENRSEIGNFAPMRSLIQNFRYKRSPPTNHFCTDSWSNECLTTLSLTVFTALHVMQTRYCDEIAVRPSVCLSVTGVNCDKTVERSVQIYIRLYERTFSLVF